MTDTGAQRSNLSDEEILAALQPLLDGNMLACHVALPLAERLGISPGRVGRICNANAIRIIDCQLGCFGRTHKPRP